MENHKLVLPEHLNQYGYLFGGYLLKWVDEVAWIAATLERPGCRFVTVGMDEVAFHKSVREGTILAFGVTQARKGTTSVTYEVVVRREEDVIFSTQVTLVRVDESGEKRALEE
jgi:acyl-CoA hydrolase